MELAIKVPGGRGNGLNALGSALLLVLVLAATLVILPRFWVSRADLEYQIPGNAGVPPGDGPLFALEADYFPRQCGRARLSGDGVLALNAYQTDSCRAAVRDLRPHLLPADLRVTWGLVPADERVRLQAMGSSAVENLRAAAGNLVKAPFFIEDYLPVIEDILRTSVRQAWNSPATRQALEGAFDSIERGPLEQLVQDLVPVVAEHARKNWWLSLRGAAGLLVGGNDPDQRRAVSQVWADIIADPQVQKQLERHLLPVLSDPQVLAIGTLLANETVRFVLKDRRSEQVAANLARDRALLNFRPIVADLQRLLVALPEGMMRLRRDRDREHNPLTTYVLHAQLRNQSRFLVLLLTAGQERELDGQLPPEPMLGRVHP